jgi:glycosyltransferase involved in cell wall biosynthesis
VPAVHRLLTRTPPGVRRFLKGLPGAATVRDRLSGAPRGPLPASGAPRPIVYLPTWLEWDVMRQRPQYLLEALARAGHPVWFVDPRLDAPRRVEPNIHLVPSLAPVPPRGVILYTHFAPVRTLFDRFEDVCVMYDLLDDLSIYREDEVGMPVERTVGFHHSDVMARADVVTVSNAVLADLHRSERQDLILLENGVDLALFTPEGPVAPEIAPIREPIVGYHGAMAAWFDVDLLDQVIRRRGEYRFVFVGPIDPRAADRMRPLLALPGVVHVDRQPASRMPEFIRGFRVGTVPFVVDGMTAAVTPLKMYEYLAIGVPVVATPLPACAAHPDVRTAQDPETFADHLDAVVDLSTPERDRLAEGAREASWDRRVSPLLTRLDELGLRSVR